jgi:hypothetical protein
VPVPGDYDDGGIGGMIGITEKLTVTQLIKKFFAFYRTQKFITVFTKVHHLYLS